MRVPDPSLLAPSDVSAVALDFKVLHPVVITRLGVFHSGARPELQSNVTVKLLQLDQEVKEPPPLSRGRVVCRVPVEAGRPSVCVAFTVAHATFSIPELLLFFFCRRRW